MAIVIGKKELLAIETRYFTAIQGIGNRTLFDRFQQAETTIINSCIDARYQGFLAYPVVDDDVIIFHGKSYEETPRLYQELEGDDLIKYEKIINETISHFQSVLERLQNSGKNDEAHFLKAAIKYIDNRFVYCYDDSVVLGVWGMKLRENVRDDIGEIRKNLFNKKRQEIEIKVDEEIEFIEDPVALAKINYNAGNNGRLYGNDILNKQLNEILTESDIPKVEPFDGYDFVGWDENPNGYEITENKEFTALYKPKKIIDPIIPPVEVFSKLPWYTRFWNWLMALFTGRGCLKWFLWLFLLLLLLLLLGWLFRSCDEGNLIPVGDRNNKDSSPISQDPRAGNESGIYDPNDPYKPSPTPPAYKDILPPQEGVLPPVVGDPEVTPGKPSIISNRINILMENEDKSIFDLAKDFKAKYPGNKYKVVYYDNVVKRMQIEIPPEEREQIKQEIPSKFSPVYKLFAFDESLFESEYIPNDPIFKDNNKRWYLDKIKATQAWDITRGSANIIVAIVDNGFNLQHPELKSKVVKPYNVWKHSKEVFPQQVDHGTHVAGTALAIGDNGQGICGIAPNCKFMPIQVANEKGLMTTTSVLDGILYALYQGANVINVSLGGQFKGLAQFSENKQRDLIQNHFKEEERLWLEIMKIATKHNATIVVAAGNDNVLAGIEALQRPDQFITVSAIDKNSRSLDKTDFSNYGSYSKISAPGVDIYSTSGPNGYQKMDGTSMAAPIVTGAVALMKSINNKLTSKEIICILQNTGLTANDKVGKLIQLDKALQKVKSGQVLDCSNIANKNNVEELLKLRAKLQQEIDSINKELKNIDNNKLKQ